MDRTSWCSKVDTVRLYASYRLNLLLLNGQNCVKGGVKKEGMGCSIRGSGKIV